MTTRYCGPGGNDANDGLSYANRKLTLNGLEDSPVQAGDVCYIAPGTYRELLTVDVSGSAGNLISYIGDYTGANTSGTRGIVRITGSDNDQTTARNNCIVASSKNYRVFQNFLLDTIASNKYLVDLTTCTYFTFTGCFFAVDNAVSVSGGLLSSGSGQSNITIQNCAVTSSRNCFYFTHTSAVDNTSHLIQNCLFLKGCSNIAVGFAYIGNGTIKNCLFDGYTATAIYAANQTAGQTLTVNNCVFVGVGTVFLGGAAGQITENYNSLFGAVTARTNTDTGANSNTYPALLDRRWFFEAVSGGNIVTPLDLASYSQLINVAGTSPSTTDLRGTGVQGAQREWGALEYDSGLYLNESAGCDYPSEDDVRSGVNYDSGGSTGNMTLPAVGDVQTGVQFGTSGTEYTGTFAAPAVGKVIDDTSYGAGGVEYTGTYKAVATGDVQNGVTFGAASAETGTFVAPAQGDVQTGVTYGNAAEYTGTFDAPAVAKVIDDTSYGAGGVEFTGTYHAPDVSEVIDSATFGAASAETGTVHLPDVGEVTSNATFGAGSALTGTYHRPETAEVISTATFGINSGQTGTVVQASVGDVEAGVTYGPSSTLTGTFVVPAVGDVEAGVTYGAAAEFTGTFAVPVEANVRNTIQYGAGGVEFTGTYVAGGGGGGSYLDSGSYSGMWLIDDFLTFAVQVRDSTGAASDADAVPSYAVYEDESAVAVASGNMAKLGAITGYYTERIQLTAVAGFETGKCYHIRVAATVGGVTTAARGDVFQMGGQQLSTDAVADVAAAVGALVPTVAISASTAASVSSGAIGIRTHHTLSQAITSTTTSNLAAATKLWLAVKSKRSDTDAQSVIFIEETAGLTVLAGAAYMTVAHGTLIVGGVAGAWTITIGMDEVATGLLTAYAETMLWAECKALVAGSTVAVWDGVCDISQGVVQTVT